MFGFVNEITIVEWPPTRTDGGVNVLEPVGFLMTFSVAVATLPVPPWVDMIAVVVFTLGPPMLDVTFTFIRQDAPGARGPVPVKVRGLGGGKLTTPGQEFIRLPGTISIPVGNGSVNEIPVWAIVSGLLIVNVIVETPVFWMT